MSGAMPISSQHRIEIGSAADEESMANTVAHENKTAKIV
jgi:hypothetical protein